MSPKRSIFQEVETEKPRQPVKGGGLIDRERAGARRAIRWWLIALFALVVVMIAVGGLTRLTDSGLSITEWRPVTGAIPPLSEADWQAEFERYQGIPEFQLQNRNMTLDEFRTIYWWEWAHRQLGRIIGLVWAVGFVAFAATRRIPPGWTGRLLLLGLLGGLQGAVGWWMVASGLGGEMVDVASYRLAVHLGLAFAILGTIAWFVFRLGRPESALLQARRAREGKLFGMSTGVLHLAFLQILIGALVAGIDAGRGYTDWPLMQGRILPPGPFDIDPWWRNFFENDGLVQFIHRYVGYILFIFGLVAWRVSRRTGNTDTRRAFDWMAVMLLGQVVLGIVTVMHGSPWYLAILHQLGAVALWVLILRARFLAQYPLPQSVRGRA